MDPQSPDPFKYFRIESGELINTLTRGCLALERGEEAENVIHELNRAAHSLKGAARLMEFFGVGNAAHSLEDAFSLLQEHSASPTTHEITDLLRQVDELQKMVADALAGGDGMRALSEESNAVEPANAPLPAVSRTTPPVARESPNVRRTITSEQLARVSTATLDEIGRCAGEVSELGSRVDRWREKLHYARRSVRSAATTLDKVWQTAGGGLDSRVNGLGANGRALDVSFKRIDTFELRSDIEDVLQEIETGFEIIGPLARRLRRLSLETKLVEVGEFSYRFEKTVRDVAIETAREVDYELTGAHIQVDRLVLQALIEPICHLLRNSVAHGIEPPAKRKKLGKPTRGEVCLSFEKTPDVIRVVVDDDGAGLDADRIRKAAGVTAIRSAEQDNGDIAEFIFRPGLTTKKHTSLTAGRGVGLDVVRNAVHRLRGSIKVESKPGRCCRFIIEVPSYLDVMDVFVLRVGGQDLLIPLARLVRTCVLKPESLTNQAGAEAILVDDCAVRLVSLGSVLGIAHSAAEGNRQVAVVRTEGHPLAFEVDSLMGQRKVVIKNVGPRLASCAVLAGAAIMSDGRPGFLLETNVLGALAKDTRFHIRRSTEAKLAEPASILVVDDSLTTRMLEKALLESAGYRVTLARDGSEALGLLAESGYDLIITDFEMPGMNGAEVAEQVRAIPHRSHIPMIMLTSRADDETKRMGLASGMQAYLVKGEFDQTEFLDKVRGLIGEVEEKQ